MRGRGRDLASSSRNGVLAVGGVLLLDRLRLTERKPRAVAAVLDEAAHLATGLVVLGALKRRSLEFTGGVLAGSVLLDIDHVPDIFGFYLLRAGGMRPRTHSIATLLAIACVPRLDGVLVGATAHLARDLATGTNAVPLMWPFWKRPYEIRYRWYAAALSTLVGLATVRSPISQP